VVEDCFDLFDAGWRTILLMECLSFFYMCLFLATFTVVLFYLFKLLYLSYFKSGAIGIKEFVVYYNRRWKILIFVEGAAFILSVLPNMFRTYLFLLYLMLFGIDLYLMYSKSLYLRNIDVIYSESTIELKLILKLVCWCVCFVSDLVIIIKIGGLKF